MLQRASGARRASEESEQATTPKAEAESPASPSEDSENGSEPEGYEVWLNNVRVIEFLREAIQDRLKKGEFDPASDGEDNIDPNLKGVSAEPEDVKPLYPALPTDMDISD